jgi:ABC-type Na+ efflux pump permease subunit
MAVLRQCSRRKIIYGKALALLLFMLLCCIGLIVFSTLGHYIFIAKTKFGMEEFFSVAETMHGTSEDVSFFTSEEIASFTVGSFFPLLDAMINR